MCARDINKSTNSSLAAADCQLQNETKLSRPGKCECDDGGGSNASHHERAQIGIASGGDGCATGMCNTKPYCTYTELVEGTQFAA